MRTSCMDKPEVTEARSDHLPWMSSARKPGRSVSTRNPRILLSSSSTLAQITATSAMEPEVIHIFSPLRTYSFPTLRARVRMPPGFEPKSGSVSPKQPSFSPFCMAGSQVCFLLVAAKGINGIHDQRGLHAHERTHAGVAAFQFLHHQAVFDVGHSGATVAFEAGAVEAEVGHGLDQFAREAAGAIALLDDGNQVVFDELAGGIADQTLVVAEQGVEVDEIHSSEL